MNIERMRERAVNLIQNAYERGYAAGSEAAFKEIEQAGKGEADNRPVEFAVKPEPKRQPVKLKATARRKATRKTGTTTKSKRARAIIANMAGDKGQISVQQAIDEAKRLDSEVTRFDIGNALKVLVTEGVLMKGATRGTYQSAAQPNGAV